MIPHVIIVGTSYSSKWGVYENANRLLLPAHGKPIIHRTIDQLSALGVDPVLVGCGQGCGKPSVQSTGDTLLASVWLAEAVPHFSKVKRTLVLFGETTWSDAGIEKAVALNDDQIWFVGRSNNTRGHRAVFAVSLPTLGIQPVKVALRAVATSRLPQDTPSLWPVFQNLQGRNPGTFSTEGPWVELDDETEYFPKPGDYTAWRQDFDGLTKPKRSKVEIINRPIKPD